LKVRDFLAGHFGGVFPQASLRDPSIGLAAFLRIKINEDLDQEENQEREQE
jgi:hypothetical protein